MTQRSGLFRSAWSPLRSLRQGNARRTARSKRRSPVAAEVLECRTLLTTFTVNSVDDDGAGSLRDAIEQANDTLGADTIEFAADLSGQTITLTSGQLTLSDGVTITGLGADQLAVSGNNNSRVFQVDDGVTAEISGLTIRGGEADSGGGILNYGNLTITSSTISGNTAVGGSHEGTLNLGNGGGIFNYGTLAITGSTLSDNNAVGDGGGLYNTSFETAGTVTITDSTISGNAVSGFFGDPGAGGGIASAGTLAITGSTVSANTALYGGYLFGGGGGILNLADATITDCTISGNTSSKGGGIANLNALGGTLTITGSTISGNTTENGDPGYGGGIYNAGTLDVINSTISNNTVYLGVGGGGIYNNSGTLTITGSTLSGNTAGVDSEAGGIWNADTLALNNTIIANSNGGSDLKNELSGTLSGSHNLIENGDTGGLTNTITGQDPQLGTLQDNGGPTFTHALLNGSVAINAGDNSLIPGGVTTDQRGFQRIIDGTVDLGAYEYGSKPPPETVTVTTADDVVDADDGVLSLREAVDQANSYQGDDTIQFDASLAGQTITLTSGQLTLSDTLGTTIIVGLGADQLTVSGNNTDRVFRVEDGVTATISGLTIRDGHVAGDGGAVLNDHGTLTITGSIIRGNTADLGGNGGGIFNDHGTLTITGSTLSDNAADVAGGIDNFGGTLTITGSTLSDNTAEGSAGGINNSGTLTITGSTLSGNTTDDTGGGIFNAGMLTIINSTLSGNSAGYGGGIFNDTTLTITSSTLSDNTAEDGGGIFNVNAGTLTLNNTIVANSTGGSDLKNNGILSGSHNLIENGDTDGLTNSITGQDPKLGDLQDNGGPTFTHALLAGSSAFDAGDDSLVPGDVATDQRGDGFPRIFGGAVDIGAFEAQTYLIITVTTADDVVDADDGVLSLREAIDQANSNAGDDAIQFDAGLAGETITLTSTSGQLMLTDTTGTTSILGLGADQLTVSGGDAHRVFNVQTGVTAEISGLTISDANTTSGGGIENNGTLTITGSTLSSNTVSGNGGGIYNNGTLTITGSTLSGNTADGGGGIYNVGTLTIIDSTLSGNTANVGGGGLFITNGGTATITNSTFSGNSAEDGGGIDNAGTLTITSSTFSDNAAEVGGGVYNVDDGTLTLNNTILANSNGGSDLTNTGSLSGSHNLVENGDTDGLTNSITGLDPQLGDLQDNGGPTFTHALLAGSPALDAGDDNLVPGDVTTDQRGDGFPRVVGSAVDIGAFERSLITVTTADDVVDADDGVLSLREAIGQANSNAGDDTIQFDAGLAGETITLTSGQLTLTDTIGTTIITGLGDDQLTVSGGDATGVFVIGPGVTAEISGLTIRDGNNDGNGGGILNLGTLTITDSTLSDNTAGWNGGGIYNNGTLTITTSTLSGNTADDGGGIYSAAGTLTITNSTLSGNNATFAGGAVVNEHGTLTITGSTLSGNNSTFNAGGIFNAHTLTVINSTLSGNTADAGGGIYNAATGTLTITGSTLSGNTAGEFGGGIFNAGTLTLNNTIVANSTGGRDLSNTGSMSGSHNLIEDGATDGLTNTITGQDPKLRELQDYGGPTFTHALLDGSPAIDAGDNSLIPSGVVTDQRGSGYDRIFDGTVDLGAFEVQTSTTTSTKQDFNGDGFADLIELGKDGRWWVGLSDGNGGFDTAVWDDWGNAADYVHVDDGDFNGDGNADVVGLDDVGEVRVGLSDGEGGFTSSAWLEDFDGDFAHVAVSDFNGDGWSDLAGFTADGQWQVALSNGEDGFNDAGTWADWADASSFAHIAVGDFDGDGRFDDVAGLGRGGRWWVALGFGAAFGDTSSWIKWSDDSHFAKIETGDFNGDGITDVACLGLGGRWWIGKNDGTAIVRTSVWMKWAESENFLKVGVADINGDGALDVVGLAQGGRLWAAISDGPAFTGTSPSSIWDDPDSLREINLFDVDGDGDADVMSLDDQGRWRVGVSDGTQFDDDEFWAEWDSADLYDSVNGGLSTRLEFNELRLA